MARIAAKHVLDESTHGFAGADMSTKLKLMGVDVASIGDAHAMTPDALSYFMPMKTHSFIRKLWSMLKNQTAWRRIGGRCQRVQ